MAFLSDRNRDQIGSEFRKIPRYSDVDGKTVPDVFSRFSDPEKTIRLKVLFIFRRSKFLVVEKFYQRTRDAKGGCPRTIRQLS